MLSPTPVMAASFDFNCLIQEWKQVEAEDKEEEEAEANEKEEEKGPKENEKKETNQQQEQQCNKTLAVFHPKCLLHVVPEDHFETPQRLEALIKCLTELKSRYTSKLDIYDSPPKCDLRWIKVVHDATYINKLLTKVPASASAQPCHATLSTQEQHNLEEEASEIYVDTFVSHFSWKAALHASGCVLYAVDRLFGNENGGSYRNAVCAIRPPGHHCGRTGRTGGVKSQGFCLINNVVVGAKYALLKYGLKRIAVVDFDVHAGNGTEELLRGDDNFLFISLHAHGQNFYPGTGGSDQPSSTSTASDTIATRGNSHRRAPQPSSSTAATTARASTRSLTSQRGLTSEVDSNNTRNIPLAHGTGSATYRKAFMKAVALLDEFKPELIFASAGFDAHKNDPTRGGTAIGMKLSEDDFRWITRQLVGCSERHCNGRLISVLEGGYDVAKALPASFRAHVAALLLPSSSSSSSSLH
ncbi:Histone deacetylase [Balamuthia mandrillaris]